MRKVAVFGNAGGGKSTLARRLAEITGLPLHTLDIVQFRGRYRPDQPDGGKIPPDEYLALHAALIAGDRWIIDGYDTAAAAFARFAAADTLVHVDLPLLTHYRWVTKRLLKGLFANPPGWPDDSPLWASSLDSYRVVWRCHRHLTPRYRKLVAEASSAKRVHHLRSPAQIDAFLAAVRREHAGGSPGLRPGSAETKPAVKTPPIMMP